MIRQRNTSPFQSIWCSLICLLIAAKILNSLVRLALASPCSPDAFHCAENRFADSGKRVVVAGVIAEIPLPAIIDLLPDYALPYLNLQPIMPAV